MKKGKILGCILASVMTVSLFAGCSNQKTSLLPKQVVAKAIEQNEKMSSYYGESKCDMYENNKLISSTNIKEWYDSKLKKTRIEVKTTKGGKSEAVSVNDGKKILSYDKNLKLAFVVDDKEVINEAVNRQSSRTQMMNFLNRMKDTHKIKKLGEEEVDGIDTYHIVCEPKEKGALIGKFEAWITKDKWFVVKCINENGNFKTVVNYTKLDFSPKMDEKLFTIDIPKNIKIQNINEMGPTQREITLKEGAKLINKPILYYKGKDVTLNKITVMEDKKTKELIELTEQYNKNNLPAFNLSINKIKELNKDEKPVKVFSDEKEIVLRGKKATSIDNKILRSIGWNEDGFHYSVVISNPQMTIDEVKAIIEKMQLQS
ncbi:outer membrane lipoprotein carrier protein LolA [Haloimpatiens sp. FM7330]|uniref:LolA family protein n=1 Tax=Haloimpatiens sp. FM7330 TaxID=3298610 RepID=UPI003634F35A